MNQPTIMGDISGLGSIVRPAKKRWNLFNPAIPALITEVGLNFFRFLRSAGMSDEHIVVLSSKDDYFCSETELKNVRIIINLKRLNLIKHLDLFLKSLVHILPPDTSFIGYFSDEKTVKGNGFNPAGFLRLLSGMFNFLGSRTNHIMDRNEVRDLLEKNGFKTLKMKNINGFTYFVSQNVGMPL